MVVSKWKAESDRYRFGGNRETAILRDGSRCVKCGMSRDEHKEKFGRDITVDHIDGKGLRSPVHLKNNEFSNLQTLCLPCHASKDNKQNKITKEQAINIRHMRGELTQREIAKRYSVSEMYISMIMRNIWRKS